MKQFYQIFAKRILATAVVVVISLISYATTYYVSLEGSDSNTGLTTSTAWKTLSKVNSVTLKAGDNVLFRRGDIFTGTLIPMNSGTSAAPILFGAYGAGLKPIITGFESVAAWTSLGNGIYSATTTAKSTLNLVTIDGVNTPMGRFPKKDWLTFESFLGRTSITDNQLTSTPNWTGAEVVIRKSNWTIDRSKITNHTGTIITYASGSSWDVTSSGDYGYFIQNHIGTLTQLGDWFCDGTKFNMFFGSNNPNNYSVKVSVVDKLVDISSRAYLVFDNIKFEGANVKGLSTSLSVNISVRSCDFSLMGDNAIHSVASQNTLIENSNFENCNGTTIYLNAINSIIRNNIVSNGGLNPGMGNLTGDTYNGISFYGAGSICEYNIVRNIGYNGIMFYSNNSEVRYNLVDGFCKFLTDGGGIYTYFGGDTSFIQSGMKMYGNIVVNGGGNGLYSDGITNNLEIYNNTVAHVGKWGIHMNEPRNNNVHDNILYNCTRSGIDIANQYHLEVSASGNIISANTIVQGASTELMINLQDARTYNVGSFGTSDKNVFITGADGLKVFRTQVSQPSFKITSYDLVSWRTFSNQELTSELKVVDLANLQVEYNATKVPLTITLSSPMVDSKGVKYSKSVVLPAYSSMVLMKDNTISPVLFTEYKSICEGTNYNSWTVTGKYERTLIAKSGGDSIVTTYLTVNPISTISEVITINEGEAYNGWTKSGQYTRTLTSVLGCDSIVATTLNVATIPVKQGEITPSHFTTSWQGENGQNHMNIVVISAIFEDLPLTIDDEIAVFSNSICVGTKKMSRTIDLLDNSSFLTIPVSQNDGTNNGFNENDTIIFKIWKNTTQQELYAKTVTYKSDIPTWQTSGRYIPGATSVVQIASYTEFSQVIELKKGYNMISTYVSAPNPMVCEITKPLTNNGFLIKVQDEAGNSFENWGSFGGWINNVGEIEKTEGYKIKVANNCELVITGRPIILPLDIPLKLGWNIISFPHTTMIDAMSIIQPLIDQNKLIKVQDEIGNSIENWGIFGGWKNGIGNFIPGKAYKVKMNADAILTLQQNYAKSAVLMPDLADAEYFSSSVEGNGTDHMNINLVGFNQSGISAGDELAAFDGDVCIGVIKLTEKHFLDGSASLVVSASSDNNSKDGFKVGNPIQINIWNHLTGCESKVEFEIINGLKKYEKNSSILTKVKSVSTNVSDLMDQVKIDMYPNPSSGKFIVRFSQITDAGSKIEILDISGRKVASRLISDNSEEFDLEHLPAGMYIVKSILGSQEINKKMIIN